MNRLLRILFIGLVFCNVCHGSFNRKCREGDPNCVDVDYHFEEAAKEMVLGDSNETSFNLLANLTVHGSTNVTNMTNDGKASWKRWYHETMQLRRINPDHYGRPLCQPFNEKEEFVLCNDTSRSTRACLVVGNPVIVQCDSIEYVKDMFPLCLEMSSDILIPCGLNHLITFFFRGNDTPIQPYANRFIQMCLSSNGSLVKCTEMESIHESLLKNTTEDTPVWWKKGKQPNLKVEEKDSGNESVALCLSNASKRQLRNCYETETHTTACFNISSGELGDCKCFTESEMIVPICSEVSSNRIQSCDKIKKEFLCFSPGNVKKRIQSCENGGHQICLNSNGVLERCSNSSVYGKRNRISEELAYAINNQKAWEYWWSEWVVHLPVTKEEEDIFLCKTNEESEKLMKCGERFPDARACVSGKSGQIEFCKKLYERDLPILLCIKGSMNKIISCSDFGSANLCFDINSETNFIRPCKPENRHLCLTDAGLVKRCSVLNPPDESGGIGDTTLSKDGSHWEVLFPITYGLENNLTEDKALCIAKDGHIFECLDTFSDTIACVGTKAGKIRDCMDMQSKESPVPICREKSSKRVVACGDRSLFPCVRGNGKLAFFYPCKSRSRQLCLTDDGLLERCRRDSKAKKSSEMELPITSRNIYGLIKAMESIKSDELMYLCKNESLLLPCNNQLLYPNACLNTKKGKIEPCDKIERNRNIGLPVCIHVNNSKLFTCGEYSESALCFPSNGKMHPLKPCKKKSKSVCITAEGKLARCPKSLKKVSHYYGEKDTPISAIDMEHMYFEYEEKNITPLCIQEDTVMLEECSTDSKINFACLSSRKGIVHSCAQAKPYNLSISLCLKGPSKFVVTCGKMNHVNLCERKKGSSYRPCSNDEYFVCFKNGLIRRCQANNFSYRVNDIYFNKFLNDVKETEKYEVSGYQNSKKVYEFESLNIQARLKNCTRVCEVKEDKNVLRSCEEDPSINFACFGVNEGIVKSCSAFGQTELIMPVCVEKSKRMATHGKFFKAYLCFQDNGDGVRIQTCSSQNEHICLTKKGSLDKCDHNEAGISSKLRKLSQKGKTSSTEQSTIKSQFNANINEALTSKENEMFEDNSEEITNDDFTEEIKAILGIKSNIKSSTMSKSKQKYKETDKEQKEKLEEPEKNVTKKKYQSKNLEGEKRDNLKKYYNKNKKQKGTKKPKTDNIKSRIKKGIDEHNNAFTIVPSLDELTDVGDEYEYYLHNSITAEKEENENYERNYSDIDVEKMLKSMHSMYQDLLQEYKVKHREAIIEKELKKIASIHMISRHLCKVTEDSDKLVDCDSDPHLRFACVGAIEGRLRRCNEFKTTDVCFPICFQANSRNLVTCDIFSNVQLNMMGSDSEACLGDNGLPVECGNHVTRRSSSSMEQFKVPHPDDEKFYRLLCTNCSIQNRFILEGNPKDVHPTLEVFTYPPE